MQINYQSEVSTTSVLSNEFKLLMNHYEDKNIPHSLNDLRSKPHFGKRVSAYGILYFRGPLESLSINTIDSSRNVYFQLYKSFRKITEHSVFEVALQNVVTTGQVRTEWWAWDPSISVISAESALFIGVLVYNMSKMRWSTDLLEITLWGCPKACWRKVSKVFICSSPLLQ